MISDKKNSQQKAFQLTRACITCVQLTALPCFILSQNHKNNIESAFFLLQKLGIFTASG